jgi:hypothetical protein
LEIKYRFHLPKADKSEVDFAVNLCDETILLQDMTQADEKNTELPEWSRLDFHQCTNCPLNKKDTPLCPVSKNIFHIVDFFKDMTSFEESKILVQTKERHYLKEGTVQEGIASIFGIIMATSGCPHLDFFRPMARFHLPFATVDETVFRSVGTFLLSKFIEGEKKGKQELVNIKELEEYYKQVNIVNRGIVERIRSISKADADRNALTILDSFAMLISLEINSQFEGLYKFFPDSKN